MTKLGVEWDCIEPTLFYIRNVSGWAGVDSDDEDGPERTMMTMTGQERQ